MSDEKRRLALVRQLEPFLDDQDCYSPAPLLSLESFFDGNDDEGSIGCNLDPHPGVSKFYETLLNLRNEDGVSGVWVLAKQHDWKPAWPHSDEVLVRTKWDMEKIASMLRQLAPDVVEYANPFDQEKDLSGCSVSCSSEERHISVWWD